MTELTTEVNAQATPDAGTDGKEAGEPKADVTPDAKPEGEEKGGDTVKGADDVVPETYDLKLPTDLVIPDAILDNLKKEAKEQGMTNAEAQEYLNLHHKVVAGFMADQTARLEVEREGWQAAVKADKEIGGEAFKENIAISQRLLKATASKDFYDKVLAAKADGGLGLGDHPEMVRLMVRLTKKGFAEDKAVHGGAAGSGLKSDVEVFYGKNK